jgi:hypothetical protein
LPVSISVTGDFGITPRIAHFQHEVGSCVTSGLRGHNIDHRRLERWGKSVVDIEIESELGIDASCVVPGGDGSQAFGSTFPKLIVPF